MLGRGTSNLRKSACMWVGLLLFVATSIGDLCPCIWECVSVCILYVFLLCWVFVCCVFVADYECMSVFVCVCVCVHASLCMSVLSNCSILFNSHF